MAHPHHFVTDGQAIDLSHSTCQYKIRKVHFRELRQLLRSPLQKVCRFGEKIVLGILLFCDGFSRQVYHYLVAQGCRDAAASRRRRDTRWDSRPMDGCGPKSFRTRIQSTLFDNVDDKGGGGTGVVKARLAALTRAADACVEVMRADGVPLSILHENWTMKTERQIVTSKAHSFGSNGK